jgi:hypothetical protein
MELLYTLPIVFKLSMPINMSILDKFKIKFQKRQQIERVVPRRTLHKIRMRFDTCV